MTGSTPGERKAAFDVESGPAEEHQTSLLLKRVRDGLLHRHGSPCGPGCSKSFVVQGSAGLFYLAIMHSAFRRWQGKSNGLAQCLSSPP